MMNELISRIDAQAPSFVGVSQAWTMAPVDDLTTETPLALVYPASDSAGTNTMDIGVVQRITTDWAIFIICPLASLDSLLGELRKALLGWQKEANYDPMTYVGGQAEDIKGDYLWWREVFRSSVHVRST